MEIVRSDPPTSRARFCRAAGFRLQPRADLDDSIVMTVRTLTIVSLLPSVSVPRVRKTLPTDNSETSWRIHPANVHTGQAGMPSQSMPGGAKCWLDE